MRQRPLYFPPGEAVHEYEYESGGEEGGNVGEFFFEALGRVAAD